MASAMGLPDQFVEGIGWRKVADGHWQLYNSWMGRNYHTGLMDVPLARFFEFGTIDHAVVPVYAKALAWKVSYGGKDFPHFARVRGSREGMAFSRGHVVSGLPESDAMGGEVRHAREGIAGYIANDLEPALQRLVEAGTVG